MNAILRYRVPIADLFNEWVPASARAGLCSRHPQRTKESQIQAHQCEYFGIGHRSQAEETMKFGTNTVRPSKAVGSGQNTLMHAWPLC